MNRDFGQTGSDRQTPAAQIQRPKEIAVCGHKCCGLCCLEAERMTLRRLRNLWCPDGDTLGVNLHGTEIKVIDWRSKSANTWSAAQ